MKKLILLSLLFMYACQNKETNHNHASHKKFQMQDENAKEIHKIAYSLGRQYAVNMREFKLDETSMNIFIQGLEEGYKTDQLPTENMIHYAKKVDEIIKNSRAENAKEKKAEGSQFVKNLLANDSSYKKTSSGLVYKIIKQGEKISTITQNAFFSLHYESKKLDDSVYESAMQGNPRKLPFRGVFKAWQEAFNLCGKGCEIEILSPPSLTYGDNGALPKIAPGEYLKYKLLFVDYFPQGI